jgi:hypothetical protein
LARQDRARNTPKLFLEDLLEQSGLDDLIGPAGYTSGSGVISALTKKPVHVSVIDELGRQLKAAAAKGMQHKADAITSIMEVFGRQDGTLRQAGYSTNTMKSAEAEKLEKVIKRPKPDPRRHVYTIRVPPSYRGWRCVFRAAQPLYYCALRNRRPDVSGKAQVGHIRSSGSLGQGTRTRT